MTTVKAIVGYAAELSTEFTVALSWPESHSLCVSQLYSKKNAQG